MADIRRYAHFYHLAEEEGYDFFYDGLFYDIPPAAPLRIVWRTAPAPVITYSWIHVLSPDKWELEWREDVRIDEATGTPDVFTAYHRIEKPLSQAHVFVMPTMYNYGTLLMSRGFSSASGVENVATQPMILAQDTFYMLVCTPTDPLNILNLHISNLEYPVR